MGHSDSRRYSQDGGFLRLFMADERRIYNFILSLVGNYNDADDLMQETAVVMLNRFDEFEPGSNFAAWGMRVARYKIMNFRKRQGNKLRLFSSETFEKILAHSEAVIERDDDRMRALQNCLLKLNEGDRRLISMRYERETTTKEVAERIGRSVEGLYQTLARIHRLLLQCIHRTLAAWEMPL
jgi:RNA polymerase sigma-70 factor (ECF subfamily)